MRAGILLGLMALAGVLTGARASTSAKSVLLISSIGRVNITAVSKVGVSYLSSSGKSVLKPWAILGQVRCEKMPIGQSAEASFTAGDYAKAKPLYAQAVEELDAHRKVLNETYSTLSAAGKSDEALRFFRTHISQPKADYDAYRKILTHRIEMVKAYLAKGIRQRAGKHDGQVQCQACSGKGTVSCRACNGRGRAACLDCRKHFENTGAKAWKKQYGQPRPSRPTYYVICPDCRGTGRKMVGYDKWKRPLYRNCDRCKGKIVAIGLTWKRATVIWSCSTCARSSTPGFVVCRKCTKGKADCKDCGGEGWVTPNRKKARPKHKPAAKPSAKRKPKADAPPFFGDETPGQKNRKDEKRKPKLSDPWGEDDDTPKDKAPKPQPKSDDDDGVGGF